MNQLLAIAICGALGSLLRFVTAEKIYRVLGMNFPYGILLVNVAGCLLVGILSALMIERFVVSAVWRAGILIGFLGGFTTFSSFSIDTFNLMEQGAFVPAVLNIILTVTLCLLATGFGVFLGRNL